MTSLIQGNNPLLARWINEYSLQIEGLIHIGAHLVQERNFYRDAGLEPVFRVEAIPEIADESRRLLKEFPSQHIVNAALWSESDKELTLNVTSGEASSSSLFELHLHKSTHPNVTLAKKIKIKTATLDSLLDGRTGYNTLVIDTQGAELEILRGSQVALQGIEQIVCEISTRELYKGAPKINQIEKHLSVAGFTLVAANINRTVGWGDGLFIRTEKANIYGAKFIKKNMEISGARFTLGTLLRSALIKLGLYEKIVQIIGRR